MTRLRLSRAAEADLIDIYLEGLRDYGPALAEAYQDRIDHAIRLIAEHPGMARERVEISPPVRVHPVGSHIIIYRSDGDGVQVLRVRHGREDWGSPAPD